LPLTAQEYRFLNCLAARAGRVVDRHTVASEVWAEEVIGGIREGRLDALVYRLREELGAQAAGYIETRRGRGYYVSPERVRRVPGTAP
jgi:DNA-binding response OmpR family regulator